MNMRTKKIMTCKGVRMKKKTKLYLPEDKCLVFVAIVPLLINPYMFVLYFLFPTLGLFVAIAYWALVFFSMERREV